MLLKAPLRGGGTAAPLFGQLEQVVSTVRSKNVSKTSHQGLKKDFKWSQNIQKCVQEVQKWIKNGSDRSWSLPEGISWQANVARRACTIAFFHLLDASETILEPLWAPKWRPKGSQEGGEMDRKLE